MTSIRTSSELLLRCTQRIFVYRYVMFHILEPELCLLKLYEFTPASRQ